MSVTVLRARDGKFMAKKIAQGANGYHVDSYDEAFWYDLIDLGDVAPTDIEGLSTVLTALESDPRAVVIRGKLADGIDPDKPVLRRIKLKGDGYPIYFVEREDGVPWIMLDFDKLTAPPGLTTTAQRLAWLVSLVPPEFADASFHYQLSSSSGLFDWEKVSAHLFYWLATPRRDSELHDWGDWINKRHLLAPGATVEDVKRPRIIDPSVFTANQPNYTACPVFLGGAVDPLIGERSGLVRKARDRVELVMPPAGAVAAIEKVERDLQRVNHQKNAAASSGALPTGTGFDDKLAAIGAPSFNKPICAAVATAVLLDGEKVNVGGLKAQLRACVDANYDQGRSGEMERYKSDHYLDEVIASAFAQFGRSDLERARARLRFHERRREEARRNSADNTFVEDESAAGDAAADGDSPASAPILVHFLDDPCGSGKSHQFRDLIFTGEERHWLYAVDKIERIDEVMGELHGHHWRAGGIEMHDAHSGKLDDDGNLETVVGQLASIRHRIDRRVARDADYRSVTFITHAALLMIPWRGEWDDHALIVDEKPGVWMCNVMEDVHRNFGLLETFFEVAQPEGDRIRLQLTEDGRRVGTSRKIDEFDKRIWPLLNLACRGRHVWVNRDGWDSRGGKRIDFYALTLPDAFAGFRQRWMAADNLSQSLLYRLWQRHGVVWSQASLPGGRKRTTSLSERGAVFYFMKHGASFTRFKQPDQPLMRAARHVAAEHNRVLYSVNNKRFAEKVHDVFGPECCGVTPRQTGTERFKSFNVAFWGAAIQATQYESDLIGQLTGMSRRALDLDREFDAMNQFAFRTIARDYESDEPFVWYVMSEAQADYFANRYGVATAHVPGVIDEPEPNKGGRKKTVGIKEMTPDEKRAYKAEKERQRYAKKSGKNPS